MTLNPSVESIMCCNVMCAHVSVLSTNCSVHNIEAAIIKPQKSVSAYGTVDRFIMESTDHTSVQQSECTSSRNGSDGQRGAQQNEHSAASAASPPKPRGSLRELRSASAREIPSPRGVKRGSATLHGDQCYVTANDDTTVYVYSLIDGTWKEIPNYPHADFQLAVVGGYLTGVGGRMQDEAQLPSNELYSLIDGEWKPHFPVMTTSRSEAAVVSCGDSLLVIGGVAVGTIGDVNDCETSVEILNTATTPKWNRSCSLPERLEFPSAACCGDSVYVVEGDGHTAYMTSTIALLRWTYGEGDVWKRIAPAPARWTTVTNVSGHLVALGGWGNDEEPTSDVHVYVTGDECWCKIGELTEPRDLVIAIPLADDKVLVVGGSRSASEDSCTVEILSAA